METWPGAIDPIVADQTSGDGFAFDLIQEDIVEDDGLAFQSTDIRYLRYPALAVAMAFHLNNQVDRADELLADRARGQSHIAHLHHVLDPGHRVSGGVGMDGGHAAVMAGVHGLEHVERFRATHLANDDAVGTHAESVVNQIALGYLAAGPLKALRAGFHAHHVRLLQLQFRRVLLYGDECARHGSISRDMAFISVVLPDPVPPEMTTFSRHRPATSNTRATG